MEHTCGQKTTGNIPLTLTGQIQKIAAVNTSSIRCMAEIQRLSKLCGMEELEQYIEHFIHDMERSILWLKAAYSFLENI